MVRLYSTITITLDRTHIPLIDMVEGLKKYLDFDKIFDFSLSYKDSHRGERSVQKHKEKERHVHS